jgi:hypothetical protein
MDYGSRISCLNLTSLFALFVFLLCRLTSGDPKSSIPTLRRHLNEHPIVEDYHNNKISKSPKKYFNAKLNVCTVFIETNNNVYLSFSTLRKKGCNAIFE